jgi:hypothetical protein
MKQRFLLFLLALSFTVTNAQVGIGTTTPNSSAQLDVSSTSKGFLPPRVSLTASNVASPITSPATGLLIYNLATAGSYPNNVTPGYYYWNGSKWTKMVTSTVDYGFVRYTGNDTGPLTVGSVVPFDASATGNLTWSGNNFTLLANKTYEIESYLAIYQSGGAVAGIFQIYNYTNSVVLASGLYISAGGGGTYYPSANGPMKCIITTSANTNIGIKFSSFYGGGGGAPGLIGSTNYLGGYAAPNQCYLLVKQIGETVQ